MPITKIPITHKFGIISESQRIGLQSRLERNSVKLLSPPQLKSTRNPLELTDEFIQKFNAVTDLDEKERLEEEARKLLARAKRRAGLKQGGQGNHVDLPKAWSELSMLAQCRGKVQEECLDTLIISLHQAPLSISHIPCLFYLAETTLYWLRTDAMNQPYLRIGEIKLLKMGYTAFLCLFYHHMVGHLKNFAELKDRLATYLSAILEGYKESEEAYGPYPGSHLSMKFIISVGKMISGDALITSEDQMKNTIYIPSAAERILSSCTPVSLPNSILQGGGKKGAEYKLSSKEEAEEDEQDVIMSPAVSPGYESSIHDLSPTLWHSLDVWRCADHLGIGFNSAIRALALCGSNLTSEHWVDVSCAIRIIGETAMRDIVVLTTLQNLAIGDIPQPKESAHLLGLPDQNDGVENDENISLESDISSKGIAASLDSMEIKFEEMLGVRDICKSDSTDHKKSGSELFLGRKKFSDISHNSRQKSTRNTSVCVLVDTPQEERAAYLTSGSGAMATKQSPGSSSYNTIPDFSSTDSRLDSAGGLKRWSGSRLSDVDDVDDEDSDLYPGDDSLVEPRSVDVTKHSQSNCMIEKPTVILIGDELVPKLQREVSFDVVDVVNSGDTDDLPKRKSSMRGAAGMTSSGITKSPSSKSVVIDPVPSTNFYSEDSNGSGASTKREPKFTITTSKHQVFEQIGITSWSWEIAFIYVEALTNVCLYGSTSNIKKMALIGNRSEDNIITSQAEMAAIRKNGSHMRLKSAGLLDLAEIEQSKQSLEGENSTEDEWSWRVRYAAILGLVKISRSCQGDKSLEGMNNVVSNMLMVRHSQERDHRVMEAFRVGQVNAQLECDLQKVSRIQTLNFRLAAGLASNYLPPLQPPAVQPAKAKFRRKVELPKPVVSSNKGPNRPSLKQEICLATALPPEPQISFNSRTDYDLKRIVEDQWRKELQEQLEMEEKQKEQELKEQQNKDKQEV